MLNLKELKFSYRTGDWQNTFVGIKKNVINGDFEFQLPKGFQSFPVNDFSSVKNLFFKTYKTYRKFFDENKKLVEDNQLDGFTEVEDGYKMEGKNGETITYSKLNMLDSILDAYNELIILSVKNKLSRTNEIDYSKIHKYLHKAIFVDEETVIVDEMEFPKKIIDSDSPTLIQMFCFIYLEIKQALEEDVESNRVKTLSVEFRENYLTHDSSIFDEETFEETMAVLKDVLDEIDRVTPYKDSDYWHFYEAVYKFLYGENEDANDEEGKIWGLSNFAVLWEELCYADVKKVVPLTQLLYADRLGKPKIFNSFNPPFYLQLNNHRDKKRKLRPDLVYTNFDGEVTYEYLNKIFDIIKVPVNEHVNIKFKAKFRNHDYLEIDNIYDKFLNKNQKYISNRNDERFSNVASINKNDFFAEVNDFFSNLSLQKILEKRPCIIDFKVIDYKYIFEDSCTVGILSQERKLDIQKQLVYEYALQLNFVGSQTSSEFWIPHFFDNLNDDFEQVARPNALFIDAGIIIYKRNFFKLQETYISEYD